MTAGGAAGTYLGGSIAKSALGAGVPKLAEGGIINRPTLAMIGEKGPEAVVPLAKGAGATTLTAAQQETNELLRALIGSNEKIGRNTADMVIS
jgi:SLT domain-containing protein